MFSLRKLKQFIETKEILLVDQEYYKNDRLDLDKIPVEEKDYVVIST